jgi:hypothetical protein
MNDNQITLRQWLEAYEQGKFASKDVDTQCEAGWYDWFCSDSALAGRLKALAPKVQRLAKSAKIDIDKVYVFFKNNCPLNGTLYDDFRFCDIETGDVIYTVVPATGFAVKQGRAELWGKENDFSKPLVDDCFANIFTYFGV